MDDKSSNQRDGTGLVVFRHTCVTWTRAGHRSSVSHDATCVPRAVFRGVWVYFEYRPRFQTPVGELLRMERAPTPTRRGPTAKGMRQPSVKTSADLVSNKHPKAMMHPTDVSGGCECAGHGIMGRRERRRSAEFDRWPCSQGRLERSLLGYVSFVSPVCG